jgi:hypothetical protein
MIKKVFVGVIVLASLIGLAFVVAESYQRPASYDACVKNCQRSYAGNSKAIQACISRCR